MWSKIRRQRYNRTTLLMVACGMFLAGIALARRVPPVPAWSWLVAAIFLGIALSKRRGSLALVLLAIFGVLLGAWRGGAFLHELQPYQTLAHQKVTLTATATIDAVYGQNSQLTFLVNDIMVEKPYPQKLPGTIKVSGFGATMVYRGDQLEISGSLYPTRGANQASIGYAELSVIGGKSTVIDTIRRKFAAGMQSALPEPAASFGLGLLVGQRNTLPADVSQTLLMVGLTHIIAVSGYNLTVLLEASRRVIGEKSKLLSVAFALLLIALFLLFAGTSASIVRAAVISALSLSAWYYGRKVRPLLLILLAAALTTYANPVYEWADISWYLSFLAFFGVLVIGPLVTKRLYKDREPPLIQQMVIETLCAEAMTVPLVLYIFGQTSLVGLLANLLVCALIPLAMLLCLIAGLAGMLAGGIAGWFAWPAVLLLTYMLDVAHLLSRIPHIFLENRYLSATDMTACYAAVAGWVVLLYVRARRRLPWYTAAEIAIPAEKLQS